MSILFYNFPEYVLNIIFWGITSDFRKQHFCGRLVDIPFVLCYHDGAADGVMDACLFDTERT